MPRRLPDRPSLELLKKQAKELLTHAREGEVAAVAMLRDLAGVASGTAKLADAQRALAREYGFPSWPRLKAHVQSLSADQIPAFVAAVQAGDVTRTREMLARHPALQARINDSLPGFHFDGTALLAAVSGKNRELIELLLENGADINQKSRWWAGGFGVLDTEHDLVDFLIARGATVDVHAASRHGMMDRLRHLVDADPSLVHARGGDGQTPLHAAKNAAIAEYLLSRGAAIDALDVDHEGTPAQWMIRDRQDVVRYLISCGCRTDILMAAALGDVALVTRHLERNPDAVRTAVTPEYFPMRDPRAGGHIYNWTLDRHATVHMIARQFGHEDVYRLLMERSPATLQLAVECRVRDEDAVRDLLARDPGVAAHLSPAEARAMVDAAQDNDAVAVRLMVSAGWPVTARGQEDGTALHWASFHGNAPMVRDLLAHGAPVDARESTYGGMPLNWAMYGSLHSWERDRGRADYGAVVAALLDAGARAPELPPELLASDAVLEVLRRRDR